MAATASRSKGEESFQKASRRNSVTIIIFCSLIGYVLGMGLISHHLNTLPRPMDQVLLYDTIIGKDTVVIDTIHFGTKDEMKNKLQKKKVEAHDDEEREPLVVVNCGCCPSDSMQLGFLQLSEREKDKADSSAAVNDKRTKEGQSARPPRSTKQARGELLMNRNPRLLIWAALVCLMVAFAFACPPIFLDQWLKLRAVFADLDLFLGWNVLSAVIVGGVLFLAPTWMAGLWLPDHFACSLGSFFADPLAFKGPLLLTILCACFGIATMFSIASGISQLDCEKLTQSTAQAFGEKFDALNKALQFALQLLAIMVAFAVLTSNSMRMAFRALLVEKDSDVLFPIEFVHVYGLFFSAVLAIIYLPIHYRLTQVGEEIAEKLKASLPSPTPPKPPQPQGLLQRVLDKLSVSGTGYQNLITALSILAPAITSFIAKFFEM